MNTHIKTGDSDPEYLAIARHYESCLDKHGATHKGMDWPKEEDLRTRFAVMLGVANHSPLKKPSILDLGCGVGLLLDYMKEKHLINSFDYTGIDISGRMVQAAKNRWPAQTFEQRDILQKPLKSQSYDYVIMNGVLTEKVSLPYNEMVKFAERIIAAAFASCRVGLAFNVMNKHVDWQRDDLFHWPFDEATAFLRKSCSRHIIFRADYGLYEYTIYVFREPKKH
jgi:SAM-dependent methyltransferase